MDDHEPFDNEPFDHEPFDHEPFPEMPPESEEPTSSSALTAPPSLSPFPTTLPTSPLIEPIAASESSHRGVARARRDQRRRTQTEGAGSARIPSPRQLRPAGQFRLPPIKITVNRNLIGIIGAVIFIIVIVIFLGRLRNDPVTSYPNAIWIGTEWTYETHEEGVIGEYARQLRERRIGTIYAWVTWLQPDQTWRGEVNFENVKAFVTQLKRAYPEAIVYGWVGVPTESAPGVTRIDDPELQGQVALFSQRVVDEFGFDGVFINAEPVWDGDQGFLTLLRSVRGTVGLDTPISAALPPDWSPAGATIPVPALITPGTEWAKEYKQSVALLVDQMAVMAYQSGLTTPEDYSQWVSYQVQVYGNMIAELNTDVEILVGIPTYPAEPPGHDPAVENITSAVVGVRSGMIALGDAARYVAGVAIYADWETDDDEWRTYQQTWLDGQ